MRAAFMMAAVQVFATRATLETFSVAATVLVSPSKMASSVRRRRANAIRDCRGGLVDEQEDGFGTTGRYAVGTWRRSPSLPFNVRSDAGAGRPINVPSLMGQPAAR